MNELAEANQAFGALATEFYLAGFTFERAMARTLQLLKDGGWRSVGDGFADINAFVRSLPLDQFKVVADQRREFVERIKGLAPEVSNRAIAGALGVGSRTIDRDAAPNGADDARNAEKTAKGGAPFGASSGRRDARLIVQRDTRAQRRDEKFARLIAPARAEGLFSIQVSDPPWEDEFGFNSRAVDNHYPLMSNEALIGMAPEIQRITPDHALHFMWVPPRLVLFGGQLLETWGFKYRSDFIWLKDKIGLGNWNRQQHEHLLIGRKGDFPAPAEEHRISSVISAPRGRHSEKPEIILAQIERWWPEATKIELFRRGPARPGWAAWGNEAEAAA